jgi:serine phosphatase RsbU (regulator of sigma subunit)
MVLCVSDAFTESLDRTGDILGAEGLMRIVQQLDSSQPDEIIPQLLDQINSLHPHNLSQDDATLILFRADGSSPSVKDNLMAPFRIMSGVRDNTQIGEPM